MKWIRQLQAIEFAEKKRHLDGMMSGYLRKCWPRLANLSVSEREYVKTHEDRMLAMKEFKWLRHVDEMFVIRGGKKVMIYKHNPELVPNRNYKLEL